MKLRKAFVPVLAIFLLAGWYLSSTDEIEGTSKAELTDQILRELRPQPTRQRVWQPRPETQLLTLESTAEVPLYGTLILRADRQDNLYVLDYGDLKIKHFTADGTFVQALGEGRGQGPGEFSGPSDFTVSNNGDVWVVDTRNGRIVVFDNQGTLAQTINLDTQPYRVSLADNGNYFTMFALTSDRLFGKFDEQNNRQLTFGHFLEDQINKAILLDGWIATTQDRGFVYAGHYSGLISAYDADGNLRFLTETLNRRPLPDLVTNSRRMTWVDREAFRTMINLSTSSHGIHAFGYFEEGIRKVGVVDTYSLEDGRYLYSHRLPISARDVLITGDYLYTIHETSIKKWRLTVEPNLAQSLVTHRSSPIPQVSRLSGPTVEPDCINHPRPIGSTQDTRTSDNNVG